MNEARRFIRYLVPGIVIVVELWMFFAVSAPADTLDFIQKDYFKNVSGSALFGSIFFGLGGLGYILATIYHGISKFNFHRFPNHLPFLKDSLNAGLIVLRRYCNGSRVPRTLSCKLNRVDAWCIMGAYYHARIHRKEYKEAHVRIVSINDILHGLGATMFGTYIITLLWGIINYYILQNCFRWSDLIVPVLLNAVIVWNYYKTAKEAANIIDGITAQFITKETSFRKQQIDLYIDEKIYRNLTTG